MSKPKLLATQAGEWSGREMKARKPEENDLYVSYLLTTLFLTHYNHRKEKIRTQSMSTNDKDSQRL